MWTKKEVEDEVLESICEETGLDVGEVQMDSLLREDLDMDSLEVTSLIQNLEEKFSISVHDGEVSHLKNVSHVVKEVCRLLAQDDLLE